MNKEMMMILPLLGEKLNDEEMGIIMKGSAVEKEIQSKAMISIDPGFIGRLMVLMSKKQQEIEELVEKLADDGVEEMEMVVQVMKSTFGIARDMKELEGYDDYRVIMAKLYEEYGIDYDFFQATMDKVMDMLEDKELLTELVKKLELGL